MTAGLPSEALQRRIDSLPDGPGVYLWKDATGQVLYVGKARNLRARARSYATADHSTSPKNQLLVRLIADIDTIVVASEAQSLLLENNLIKEYQPRFNVRLKDDKSYPSIAITLRDPFPRILVTRRRDIPGARYFGPYTDVAEMRRVLQLVRRIFTVRSCADDIPRERRERPCLDFHIGRCRAPCVGWEDQNAYRAMIGEVIAFLEGRTADVRARIRDMMQQAAGREDYERARDLRDALKWLDQVETPATVEAVGTGDADVIGYARDGDDAVALLLRVREGRVMAPDHRFLENLEEEPDPAILEAFLVRYYVPVEGRADRVLLPFAPAELGTVESLLPGTTWTVPVRGTGRRWVELAERNARHLLEGLRLESFEADQRAEDPVYALGRDLGLSVVPRFIVCVDISTSQGRDTVGSLVAFEGGRPRKSEYRKFRIRAPEGQQDDYAAIHEVVTRYLTRRRDEGLPIPDLFVIDGGKGQLAAALEAARELGFDRMPLIGLAKKEEEIFLPERGDALRLPRRSPSLRLLQRLRDEAHRFGVAYGRNRRTARTITSALLEIPGIGATRRSRLIERFGSLAGVKSASAAEIAQLPGFSTALAERILTYLRERA
ncbi:MAG TPA: excinuclease ABC subunit UvrC [Gemmatimonadales bacterium]|nr:excinuclease ABC subunit UvrC [Gemmatimonadales bacterium]